MPHSGSGLYFCSLWGAAMSFLIFSVYCFTALIQTKEISRQGPIFWVLNFHSEEPLKSFQSHPLYIYLKWLISAWVPAELVCDLLDCFILLCNLILPPALYLGVWSAIRDLSRTQTGRSTLFSDAEVRIWLTNSLQHSVCLGSAVALLCLTLPSLESLEFNCQAQGGL